jgi:hypothetical protein
MTETTGGLSESLLAHERREWWRGLRVVAIAFGLLIALCALVMFLLGPVTWWAAASDGSSHLADQQRATDINNIRWNIVRLVVYAAGATAVYVVFAVAVPRVRAGSGFLTRRRPTNRKDPTA